jgi:hypothetical protein
MDGTLVESLQGAAVSGFLSPTCLEPRCGPATSLTAALLIVVAGLVFGQDVARAAISD